MNNISFYSEDIDFQLENEGFIAQWVNQSIENESLNPGEISVVFTSDEYLLNLNKSALNHDYYTDIITFDYTESRKISGDLFISVDRVKENAISFQEPFQRELSRVVIHGVLHLCGYKDKSDDEKTLMREKENFYLSLQSKN